MFLSRDHETVEHAHGKHHGVIKAESLDPVLSTSVLFDIAKFSLDNAIMKLNGELLLQKQGIPTWGTQCGDKQTLKYCPSCARLLR